SDTDRTGFDTGAFASAGLFVSGKAVERAAIALRERILGLAATISGMAVGSCALEADGVVCGDDKVSLLELYETAKHRGSPLTESRKGFGSPRSVTWNAHGFHLAVNKITGEIQILYSVQATDVGVAINPMQVRGQIEGGVVQAIGFALIENWNL